MAASISKYRRKLELLRAIEKEVNADKDWQQIANGVRAIVCELRRLIEASDAVNDSWCEAATCDRPATWTVHAQHDALPVSGHLHGPRANRFRDQLAVRQGQRPALKA